MIAIRSRKQSLRLLCGILTAGLVLQSAAAENVYETFAAEGSVTLNAELLASVESPEDAAEAVSVLANDMSDSQKADPAGVDQAARFAEAAAAAAVRMKVENSTIRICRETVEPLAGTARHAQTGVETALREGGVSVNRDIAVTVVFETDAADVTLVISPDALDAGVDKIRVEAADRYAVTVRPEALREELEKGAPLTITAREQPDEYEPGTSVPVPAVRLEMPEGQLSAPVTLSLYPGSEEPSSLTVLGREGSTPSNRYNAATRTLDAMVSASDLYTFGRSDLRFPDLTGKNEKVRLAIEALSRVNVIHGYADNTFRPDNPVTRAQFVAFVVRALGRVNNALKSPFPDVTESHGCYHEIASASYYGIIHGYDDGLFHGDYLISKTQIYAIVGRILRSELGYRSPDSPDDYLSGEFADEVPAWARSDVALAVREGLVIRQDDSCFAGTQNVNRGDVALIIYGLYQRIA